MKGVIRSTTAVPPPLPSREGGGERDNRGSFRCVVGGWVGVQGCFGWMKRRRSLDKKRRIPQGGKGGGGGKVVAKEGKKEEGLAHQGFPTFLISRE